MNQSLVYLCPLPLEHLPPSSSLHLLPHPTLQDVTEAWLEFAESYAKFPLAIYFTFGNVYFHVTVSTGLTLSFLPPYPQPRPEVCSLCLSLLLLCKQVHQYHLSRFHIYALVYDICFSLSDLLPGHDSSTWFIHITTNYPILFLFFVDFSTLVLPSHLPIPLAFYSVLEI